MKKALFLAGGWDGHEPQQVSALFAGLLQQEGYETEISLTLDTLLDAAKLASLDLIVPMWTMSTITKEQEKGLLQTIKAGAGLAGWHGGMADSFRQNTEYQWMVGGQWVAHPGNIIDYTVNITNHDDPITITIKGEGVICSQCLYFRCQFLWMCPCKF